MTGSDRSGSRPTPSSSSSSLMPLKSPGHRRSLPVVSGTSTPRCPAAGGGVCALCISYPWRRRGSSREEGTRDLSSAAAPAVAWLRRWRLTGPPGVFATPRTHRHTHAHTGRSSCACRNVPGGLDHVVDGVASELPSGRQLGEPLHALSTLERRQDSGSRFPGARVVAGCGC